ncbi:MAG: transcription antitermination factor NusB [Oligosphaeraceae bacterium]
MCTPSAPSREEGSPRQRQEPPRSFRLQRTTSRHLALQLLYALECNLGWTEPLPQDLEPVLALIVDEQLSEEELEQGKKPLPRSVLRKSWSRSRKLAEGVREALPQLDSAISAAAKNWPISRISLLDRNILRLATYEMLLSQTPVSPAIAINEAVDLAHAFGQKDSWRFVNGVLDQIRKSHTPRSFTLGAPTEA